MKFTTLAQVEYKDSNGNHIPADKVQCIAPYKHIIDGFYEWECGQCHEKDNSRSCGWPIAGQVLSCPKCGYMNLLVKTNTEELDKYFGRNLSLEELDRQIEDRKKNLNQFVYKSSLSSLSGEYEKFKKASEDFARAQSSWQCSFNNCRDILGKEQ